MVACAVLHNMAVPDDGLGTQEAPPRHKEPAGLDTRSPRAPRRGRPKEPARAAGAAAPQRGAAAAGSGPGSAAGLGSLAELPPARVAELAARFTCATQDLQLLGYLRPTGRRRGVYAHRLIFPPPPVMGADEAAADSE